MSLVIGQKAPDFCMETTKKWTRWITRLNFPIILVNG